MQIIDNFECLCIDNEDMTIRFEPIKEHCAEIIEKLMASSDMPNDEGMLFKIRLCIEEAVVNIVEYAYGRGDGWLEAETTNDGKSIRIILRDAGTPFDPLDKPDPDITLSVEERQIGGLGIFLCKQIMDEVSYAYEGGCNILSMTMKF